MNEQHISDDRQLVKEISQIECLIVEEICNDSKWLSHFEETSLRWALSFARISKVRDREKPSNPDVVIGHATDRYRESLFNTLKPFVQHDGSFDKKEIKRFCEAIGKLCADEREDLLQLYGQQLNPDDLDDAVQTRPLALSLGGGGGTAYIYLGAFAAMQKMGILPSAISGTSMGAVVGAHRALHRDFSLENLSSLIENVRFEHLARPFEVRNKFSVPSTFRLNLREVFESEFTDNKQRLRLKDLEIPFRVVIGGIEHVKGEKDRSFDEYEHLLDESTQDASFLKKKSKGIIVKLLEMAKWPLKAICLGSDELSSEFDVIDAMGFSAAVPGIFHYDIKQGDKRMQKLVEEIMQREDVYRLLDGGWVDNLPSQCVFDAVQNDSRCMGRDPFVLAFDAFAPNFHRHWIFLPVMQMAARNSKEGREMAHRTVAFKHVLSPLNIVPSIQEFHRVVNNGIAEISPHLEFIKKMIGPIDKPKFIKKKI